MYTIEERKWHPSGDWLDGYPRKLASAHALIDAFGIAFSWIGPVRKNGQCIAIVDDTGRTLYNLFDGLPEHNAQQLRRFIINQVLSGSEGELE